MLLKIKQACTGIEFPVTHINILYCWLLTQGYSTAELLKNTTLTADMFADGQGYMAFSLQQQFIVNVLDLTDNELLGIELGRYIGSHSSGLLGYAIKCAPTINEALDILSQNFKFRSSLFVVRKVVSAQACLLIFDEATEFDRVRTFLLLMFISTCITLFNQEDKPSNIICSVTLTISKPQSWDHHLYPGIRFYFDANQNSVTFDTKFLDKKMLASDPLTLHNLQEYFTLKSLDNFDESFITQVRRVINKRLSFSPTQDEVAAELGLSTRSLRRKLQERESTYKDILNNLRAQKTIHLLKEKKLRIYQICELMGYNNLSNFRRAFKSWTGKSFKDFR